MTREIQSKITFLIKEKYYIYKIINVIGTFSLSAKFFLKKSLKTSVPKVHNFPYE